MKKLLKSTYIVLEIYMSRLEKLLEKQLNKPHDYNHLKENPFPYL